MKFYHKSKLNLKILSKKFSDINYHSLDRNKDIVSRFQSFIDSSIETIFEHINKIQRKYMKKNCRNPVV